MKVLTSNRHIYQQLTTTNKDIDQQLPTSNRSNMEVLASVQPRQ